MDFRPITLCKKAVAVGATALFFLFALMPVSRAAERSIAIWDFDNNTIAGMGAIINVDYLTRALPEMLLSRLAAVPGLKMVERVHLQKALEELKLGSSALADEDGRLKLGRIVGAQEMIFGSFIVIGPTVRVDVRVVDVASSLTPVAEAVSGPVGDITKLSDILTQKIAVKLAGAAPPAAAGGSRQDPKVWEQYDKGIQLIDKHQFDEAIAVFQDVLKQHPDFSPAEHQIKVVLERMARQ